MSGVETLLVDGYISQTFRSRAAEQYFLTLLKSTSIPPHATLSSNGSGSCFFFVHSVPPHIAAQFPNPPDRWLLDRGTTVSGSVVPQKMWSPHSAIDRRRYIERAELQMPVFFECKDGEALGLSLEVSIDGPGHILRVANDLAPLGQKTTTHIRIAWPGYKTFKREIPIRDDSGERNAITMAKFVGRVGRTVDKFLQACELDPDCVDDPGKLWRIGPGGIQRSDIIIIAAVHISAGSWMPIMQLNRYIFS
ncbi:hypothetical protein V8E53_010550 [Lactarius tabidus]